jgi:hypothetical protein
MRTPSDHTSGGLGRYGGVYAALHAAHTFADHVIQNGDDAQAKAGTGWPARAACARHVAELTATQIVALAAVSARTGEQLNLRRVATHYLLDRRPFARRLAHALGKADFYDRFKVNRGSWVDPHGPGSGPYALDQAWHTAFLAVTAAIITGRTRP